MIARYLYQVMRSIFFHARLHGRANLRSTEPMIMVANHAGALGPVTIITNLPLEMHPWVSNEITDAKTAAARIQAEFLEQELHLKPPLSAYLAKVIGRICAALMRDIGAVPVYPKSKRIGSTLLRSLSLLEKGKSIIVFAEDSTRRLNDVLCELCTGFIHLARLYHERTRKAIQFLPVAVNRTARGILIGTPIRFDGTRPFALEKRMLKRELEDTICALYREMENAPDHRTRRPA